MTAICRISNGQPYDTPVRVVRCDGEFFAVLPCEYDADDFAQDILGRENATRACFDGYGNAVVLTEEEFRRFAK